MAKPPDGFLGLFPVGRTGPGNSAHRPVESMKYHERGLPCAPPKAARKLHSRFIRDNLVKSLKFSSFVILAKATYEK